MLAGTVLACMTAFASADTQIVSKVTFKLDVVAALGAVTEDQPPVQPPDIAPQTVTAYYKGGNARVEVEGGIIRIFNGKDGKVYTLDPVAKTYYVQTLKQLADASTEDPDSRQSGSLKVSSDLSVSPGDGNKSCAGLDSKPFVLSGSISISHKQSSAGGLLSSLGGLAGGLGGLGGLAGGLAGGLGGGGDQQGGGRRSGAAKQVEVSGEYWFSNTVKLPDDKGATVLPALYTGAQIQGFVCKALSDKLVKMKGLPLDSRIAVSSSQRDGSQRTITRTTEVTSVSLHPLPDGLFQLPVGYTQLATIN